MDASPPHPNDGTAASDQRADASSTWQAPFATTLALTLSTLRHGAYDPTHGVAADGAIWRTTLTPDGPASLRFTQTGLHTIRCEAWGAGARAAVAVAPDMAGALDDPSTFTPDDARLNDAHRRWPGLRIPRTSRVMESLIPAILEQKVIGVQAMASWRRLVSAYGTPAPGPAPRGMMVVPSTRTWQLIPSWEWHKAGVDPRRAGVVQVCLGLARQLEAAATLSTADASARLRVVPGIGVWTAAEVAQRAFGDADALSVGDYHLADVVGHSLFGRSFTDAQMVEAMHKWRPHRYRVVRLLEVSGTAQKPRHGPRLSFVDHRHR
ncbi:DNA-3-methyladenine glycosylase 2 family protein [Cryobacterium sp. CG_9.6]|uniref:DNA-3-methyladenine glycosylase family protein n=1 Tax=Cryobacterium sp. CG_9.6 TaxID=2760710 RepID=UPI002474B82F|nr:DNA-3-methyladenine glycosylase 2 family protein [Cryobacterium sp. CG_9.6]MDH6235971.1 3-methyladenine DNA glycosylase/8-oxoguanine DNA glycosylase [Cryobacterium sp. CG_9.6]